MEPLLAAGILGSLDDDQRKSLADHLATCTACRALSADLADNPVAGALLDEGVVSGEDFPELGIVPPENYVRGEEIGRGGMGRVVRARDRRLGRSVVIKELLDGRLRERFEEEARLTARLQHPAIVNVHEAGRWPSGDSFYAMKHVAGQPLDRAIAARPTLAARLALLPNLIIVVEAIAYAHSQRVIHRDLKPANILVGPFGETVVIDWGLAKDLSRDDEDGTSPYRGGGVTAFTVAGAGTPSYMPPEQAAGRSSDERVDVFALGATLHHLLAGAPPGAQPLPAEAPRALVAIVHKAMAAKPADRYASAAELAEELKRFQSGQLVGAHNYSLGERVERFVRRNKAFVAATVLSLSVLGVVGGISLHQVLEARRRAETQLAELLLERGREELDRGFPSRSLVYLAEAQRRGLDTPALRSLLGDATRPADELRDDVALPVHPVLARIGPDGTRAVTYDEKGELVLWDVRARRRLARLGISASLPIVAFAPAGRTLLVAVGPVLRVWDSADGALRGVIVQSTQFDTARFHGDEMIFTVAGLVCATWTLAGAPQAVLIQPNYLPRWIAPSADGLAISIVETAHEAAASSEQPLEMARQEAVTWLSAVGRGRPAHLRALSPGGTLELTVSAGSGVAELRRATPAPNAPTITLRHGAPIAAIRFETGGATAVTTSRDGTIRLWDTQTGLEGAVFDAGAEPLDTHVEGDQLVAVTDLGHVRTWRTRGRLVATRENEGGYRKVAFSPDGRIAALAVSGEVEVLDRDGETIARDTTLGRDATVAGFVEGGRALLFAGHRGVVRWRFPDEARLMSSAPIEALGVLAEGGLILDERALLINPEGVPVIALDLISPTLAPGGRLVVGMTDDTEHVAVRDATSGRLMAGLAVEHNPTLATHQLALSPRGDLLATVLSDRAVALWDVTTGQRQATLVAPGAIELVVWSGDGERVLVSGATAGTLVFSRDGALLATLAVVAPRAADFDPEGERVLVGELDGTAHMFDTTSGMELATFGPLAAPVGAVAFAPDGSRAVVVAGEHFAVWDTRHAHRTRAQVARLAAELPLRLEGGRLVAPPLPATTEATTSPAARARRAYDKGMSMLVRRRFRSAIAPITLAMSLDPRKEFALALSYAFIGMGPQAPPERRVLESALAQQEMRHLFERAQDLYELRKYDEAALVFLQSYEVQPVATALFNVAVCYEKLHRYAEAATMFRRYLDARPAATRDRDSVEARIAVLMREATMPR